MSPTQRTLAWLEKQGWKSGIVERFNRFGGKFGFRSDYLGIIDIISLTPEGVVGVQSTGQDFSGHYKKITEEQKENTRAWLSCPGTRLLLIGWRKVKKVRGGKAMEWKPRLHWFTLEDLQP